ncbi:hypothetical protein [Merismopedia glauca]|uniref:Uncharacterized protein n=1 Tax=Merismopedia glauca CCAP 1448/3 TaxID=1296344 RepID=A0A2T1C2I7_9CYAN|nr:hypothetical protein [Merismopedia glauca]PSB02462.1 hypothetical protein C7B64_13015 [Merismopedia glauca CCAP 1448/3]
MQRWISVCLGTLGCINIGAIAAAQTPTPNPTPSPESVVSPVTTINLKPGEALRVKLDRIPATTEGKLAVFVDNTDVTSQVQIIGNEIVYQSQILPLSTGEHQLTVYLVKSVDAWEAIATFPIKVTDANIPIPATTPPTEAITQANPLTITPRLAVNIKSQFSESRTLDAGISERPTFTDIAFTGGFSSQYQKDRTNLNSNFTLVGSSFQQEALRFSELQETAPQIDLSEYLFDLNFGNTQIVAGHMCYGNHPFLISSTCSRGLSAKIKLNDVVDISAAQISSTRIVGFDNFFGLAEEENNLTAATLGLQILQNPAGGVRLDTTWMDGSRLPISSFNVGEVVDAEESQGIGLRLIGADESGRLKADLGFVRSTFTTPSLNDPQLTEGLDIVEVEPVTRNAWYGEANYDLLKDIKLDDTRSLSLALNLRHERIEPQFGTLGTTVTADQLQTKYGLNAAIAGATIQVQHIRLSDNLANLPNILKTQTRNTSLSVNAPFQSIFLNNSPLLPTLTYNFQETQQAGSIINALEGGFDEFSEIPDQFNTSHQIGINWTTPQLTFSYQYTNAFQDNRQLGRENADFKNIGHQFSATWQPSSRFSLSLGYNLNSAKNFEQEVTRFTHSPTLGLSWEFIPSWTFACNYNRSDDTDSLDESFNRGENLDLLLTWQFKVQSLGREIPGSFFIRYGRQSTLNQNSLFDLNTNATIETVNGGLNFSF